MNTPQKQRPVTSEEFYRVIGPQDAIISVEGNSPYTAVFKLRRSGKILGKGVDRYGQGDEDHIVTDYYLYE